MNERKIIISIARQDSTAKDVERCIRIILGTRAGEQALDRQFGIDWSCLDMPTETAKAACAAEIISKIKKYEPRAHISRVTFTGDINGNFTPRIEVDRLNV